MPDTPDRPATPGADPARYFLLDPDETYEVTCPDCDETVAISDGAVFHGSEGERLDHEPTLGDLIDAASAHECKGWWGSDGN